MLSASCLVSLLVLPLGVVASQSQVITAQQIGLVNNRPPIGIGGVDNKPIGPMAAQHVEKVDTIKPVGGVEIKPLGCVGDEPQEFWRLDTRNPRYVQTQGFAPLHSDATAADHVDTFGKIFDTLEEISHYVGQVQSSNKRYYAYLIDAQGMPDSRSEPPNETETAQEVTRRKFLVTSVTWSGRVQGYRALARVETRLRNPLVDFGEFITNEKYVEQHPSKQIDPMGPLPTKHPRPTRSPSPKGRKPTDSIGLR